MKKITIRKEVRPGEVIPKYYGAAYWDHQRGIGYVYLIPINLIARFFYWLWQETIRFRPTKLDKVIDDAIQEAYERGRRAERGDQAIRAAQEYLEATNKPRERD
jgi:hypothetical protein